MISRHWRPFKVGSLVRILRRDIWEFRNWGEARRPRGRITKVNGGYIYVRPTLWGKARRPALELYENEIEVLS